jgi:hypothetical protein
MSLKSAFYANTGKDKNLLTTLVVPIGVLFYSACHHPLSSNPPSQKKRGSELHGKSDNDILIPENRSTPPDIM